MNLPHIESIGFSCSDLEATSRFFCEGLGFAAGESQEIQGGPYAALMGLPGAVLRLQRLRIGAETLELTQVLEAGAAARPGRSLPVDSRSNDHWFQHICLVVSSMDAALAQLAAVRPSCAADAISSAPQRLPDWNAGAAGIIAYKFRDPEGHPLELLQFPPDKGDPRWHGGPGQGSGRAAIATGPVLGIDHSAIGIADTEASRRFYTDLLGLRLGGEGVNSGPEQEALDGLAGVEVRISSLRCAEGAGLECLDYRQPHGGRPMPADHGPQDRAHWQVRLRVASLEPIAAGAEAAGGRLISAGIVELGAQGSLNGGRRALQLADPDGHRLQLIEP